MIWVAVILTALFGLTVAFLVGMTLDIEWLEKACLAILVTVAIVLLVLSLTATWVVALSEVT